MTGPIYSVETPIAALKKGMSKAFDLPFGLYRIWSIELNYVRVISADCGDEYRILNCDLDRMVA